MQRQRRAGGIDECTGINVQPSPRLSILIAEYHQPSPLKGGPPALLPPFFFYFFPKCIHPGEQNLVENLLYKATTEISTCNPFQNLPVINTAGQ